MNEQRLPPVTQLGMLSLALVIAGGIYLSAHLPSHVPLGPAFALARRVGALLAINMILLSRVREFAWERFFAGRQVVAAGVCGHRGDDRVRVPAITPVGARSSC